MSGLFYLATPYSKYPGGIDEAFKMACRAAGALLRSGVPVYSPIAHTHPIAIYSEIDPFDHDIWLPFDEAIMSHACGILVYRADGWETSKGISHEIAFFVRAGKPIIEIDEGPLGDELTQRLRNIASTA